MKFFTGKLFWVAAYLALVSAPLVVLLIGEHPGGSGFWLDLSIALGYAGMAMVGITLDEQKNLAGPAAAITEIQAQDSAVKVLIIPTNEELEIAIQAVEVMSRE